MPSPHKAILTPSILAGDHANLAASAKLVADLGLTWIHLDLMDGHFVPNLTFGPETLAALRHAGSKLFFDTHLMLAEPHRYLEAFAKAGANLISAPHSHGFVRSAASAASSSTPARPRTPSNRCWLRLISSSS